MSRLFGSVLNMIINDVLAEVLLIISTIYFTFTTAALMGLSGPMAILAFNIFFENSTLSKEGELALKKFCESAQFFCAIYLAGTAGFVWFEELWDEIGFINSDATDGYDMSFLTADLSWIVILYVFFVSVRIVFLLLLSKGLRNSAIRWKEALLLGWGEIPGPIAIIMAFIALLDPELRWMPGCSSDDFDPTNPFARWSARSIGPCEGDVDILNMTYSFIDTPVAKTTLSRLYGVGQQKIFFYGIGVLILGTKF